MVCITARDQFAWVCTICLLLLHTVGVSRAIAWEGQGKRVRLMAGTKKIWSGPRKWGGGLQSLPLGQGPLGGETGSTTAKGIGSWGGHSWGRWVGQGEQGRWEGGRNASQSKFAWTRKEINVFPFKTRPFLFPFFLFFFFNPWLFSFFFSFVWWEIRFFLAFLVLDSFKPFITVQVFLMGLNLSVCERVLNATLSNPFQRRSQSLLRPFSNPFLVIRE